MDHTRWISVKESLPEPHVDVEIRYEDMRFKGVNKPLTEGVDYISIYNYKWHVRDSRGKSKIRKNGVVEWRYIIWDEQKEELKNELIDSRLIKTRLE